MKNIFLILLSIVFFTSCGKYSEKEIKAFDAEIASYVKKNKLDMEQSESGLYYKVHEEGEGAPIRQTAILSAIYTGRLLNGEVFDEQKTPMELTLSNLIHGWREVVYYLRPGGKATIIVPPQLGYGKQKLPKVPENSILIFDIEIVDVY